MAEIYLLEQLTAFARCGTLSAAAAEMHLSQPSLSRSMQKLEAEFGVPLFEREKGKITLNETGKFAASLAEQMIIQNKEMVSRVAAFSRSIHSITCGSCAPWPMNYLYSILQDSFSDKTITTELDEESSLIRRLQEKQLQLAILRENPRDASLFCQHFADETLYISVPPEHPFAQKNELMLSDLNGESVLVYKKVGFWMDIVKTLAPKANLLVQNSLEALVEIATSSSLPVFNSDRMIAARTIQSDRKDIPFADPEAHVSYYVACLDEDKKNYGSFFSAIRASRITSRRR